MSPTLHLSRSTPPAVFDAVCEAVVGVKVTEDTRRKAGLLREAVFNAKRPGKGSYCTPLRELRRQGFADIEITLPREFDTVAAYLDHYIVEKHPDVARFEEFGRKGLGAFKADSYAEACGLNVVQGMGATQSASQVQEIMRIQGAANPGVPKIPLNLLSCVSGLYWN